MSFTQSGHIKEWARRNKTVLVAGSIVTVGGVTAYYLNAPKVLGISLVGASAYIAYQALCKEDTFQEKLTNIKRQNSEIQNMHTTIRTNLATILRTTTKISESTVQINQTLEEIILNISNNTRELPDTSFLLDITQLPDKTNNILVVTINNSILAREICENITKLQHQSTVFGTALTSLEEEVKNFDTILSRGTTALVNTIETGTKMLV